MYKNKKIVLGVTGAIAAYKSVELVRLLREQGALVRVVMTPAAKAFVTPLTFQAISGQPVYDELFSQAGDNAMPHIDLARWPDLILVAPASADFIARVSQGQANDLLTTICLATKAPIILAPSMNQQMWHNLITQDNIQQAQKYGMKILGPAVGSQACGEFGLGRMLEPEELLQALPNFFPKKKCSHLKILITAGPTREPIDPVRYLSNASSGKMGYALAEAAHQLGAQVTLISGPTALSVSPEIQRISVTTAEQMQAAVMESISACDIFISAAAVVDYRVEAVLNQKIKKSPESMTLTLIPNEDILAKVGSLPNKPFLVGFALETENLIENAKAKLNRKNIDMIIANEVGTETGAETEKNSVTVITKTEEIKSFALMPKSQLAQELLTHILSQKEFIFVAHN